VETPIQYLATISKLFPYWRANPPPPKRYCTCCEAIALPTYAESHHLVGDSDHELNSRSSCPPRHGQCFADGGCGEWRRSTAPGQRLFLLFLMQMMLIGEQILQELHSLALLQQQQALLQAMQMQQSMTPSSSSGNGASVLGLYQQLLSQQLSQQPQQPRSLVGTPVSSQQQPAQGVSSLPHQFNATLQLVSWLNLC